MEDLIGDSITVKKGTKTVSKTGQQTGSTLHGARVVALYFAAHWAPPCRAFTEMLAAFYIEQNVRNEKGCFEVILISDDKTHKAYEAHFAQMPWVALPFQETQRKDEIKKLFGVNGIPALVVLGYPDCLVITDDGVGSILTRGNGAWNDWEYELARVRARKRDTVEEFQAQALVRQMIDYSVNGDGIKPISLHSSQEIMIEQTSTHSEVK